MNKEPMNILTDLYALPPEFAAQGAAVAIGNFDGVHLGHRRLLDQLLAVARAHDFIAVVLTFSPHPRHFFGDPAKVPQITSQAKKMALLAEAGVTCTVVLPFNEALAAMEADAFVRDILVAQLHAKAVVIGENAVFGTNKGGGYALLRALGQSLALKGAGLGFTARAVPRLRTEHEVVSSGLIREILRAGRVAEAAQLLGRYHSVDGRVVQGRRRGRTLGFPTANLQPEGDLTPPDGVYAAWAKCEDGAVHQAVVSIGVNPTFDEEDLCIEAHLLDFSKDIYGQNLSVLFVERLRDMVKFPDAKALAAQITADIDRAKAMLATAPLGSPLPGLSSSPIFT